MREPSQSMWRFFLFCQKSVNFTSIQQKKSTCGKIKIREKENIIMNILNLTCPGCGAQMIVRPGEKEAVCEYCGHRIIIEEESKEQAAYERRKGILRADEEMKKEQKSKEVWKKKGNIR